MYAHRYGMSKGMESPVMDDCVMAYHFFQVSLYDLTPHINIKSVIFLYVVILNLFYIILCTCVCKK